MEPPFRGKYSRHRSSGCLIRRDSSGETLKGSQGRDQITSSEALKWFLIAPYYQLYCAFYLLLYTVLTSYTAIHTFFTYSYLHLYTGLLNVLVLIVYLKAWNFIT